VNKRTYLSLLFVGSALAAVEPASALAQAAPPAPPAASAANTLGEIVVTARRREENLQTTPVAITAVTGETLEKRNVINLAQISRIAPSLQVYQTVGGIGSAGMFMRGIGYADNVPGQDNPIGVYIDGVYGGRLGAGLMDLVEPDSVQVLRGPQGTLFGRNTTGGAILITTHTPRDEFNGDVKASYGTYSAKQFQVRIDTGLLGASGIKTSFAYQHRSRDGTFNSPLRPADQDPGAERSDAYWFKGVGEWGPVTATLTADYNELKGFPAPLQVIAANPTVTSFINYAIANYGTPPYAITTTPLRDLNDATRGEQRVWTEGVGLTLVYNLNQYLSLKSITGLRAYERHDPSAYGPANLVGNTGTAAAPKLVTFDGLYSLQDRGQGVRARSEELQALGNAGDFDYVGGFYYYDEDAWDNARTRLPFVTSPTTALEIIQHRMVTVQSKSTAVFLQGDWKPGFLDKKFELSAGIRYTKDTRDFNETGTVIHITEIENHNTSYLIGGKYQFTDHAMGFIRYSTGYRAGGLNARAPTTGDPIFLPERLKALEAGFKVDFLDNRVRLNGSLFRNIYSDLQTGGFVAPTSGTVGGNAAINANAKYLGYELELQAIPVTGLTLTASVGHVDPEYQNYPTALGTGGVVNPGCTPIRNSAGLLASQDCAKTAKFLYYPKTTLDFSANYEAPATTYGVWSAFLSYSYKSSLDFSTFLLPSMPYQTLLHQDAYGVLAARIQLTDIPISGNVHGQIALYGDNLTDKIYDTQGIDFGTFATAGWSVGRTVGIEGKVNF
jgi:iron complex outermembrane receptor protein